MTSSLRKGPKGGDPVMARNPATQRTPETGSERKTPRTSRVDLLRYSARIFPATRKSIPLVRE